MGVVNRTKDEQEERWQLRDVVESDSGDRGIIVRNDTSDYVIMPTIEDHAHQTSQSFGDYEIGVLRQDKSCLWHKVNTKLVIE